MQSCAFPVVEVVTLVRPRELDDRPFRQSGRLLEDEVAILDLGLERLHDSDSSRSAAGLPSVTWNDGDGWLRRVSFQSEIPLFDNPPGAHRCANYSSTIASASISTSQAGSIREATWTIVLTGRTAEKNSPCTAPTASQSSIRVR